MSFVTRTVRKGGVIRYDGVDWTVSGPLTVTPGTKVEVDTNTRFYRGTFSLIAWVGERPLCFRRRRGLSL